MDTGTVLQIISMLEGDAKSYIKHLDNTNDPFETGYIEGYHDALTKHAYMLQEYIELQVAQVEHAMNQGE
jgi:DNA-binding ferritin-like protein